MAYDTALADQIRGLLCGEEVREQAAFGGLAFLVGGHMAISASGQGGALVRCAPEQTQELLDPPGVQRFSMRGREMDGWLHVTGEALADLPHWVAVGVGYATSLPPKG